MHASGVSGTERIMTKIDSVDLLGERPAYTLYFTSPAVINLR